MANITALQETISELTATVESLQETIDEHTSTMSSMDTNLTNWYVRLTPTRVLSLRALADHRRASSSPRKDLMLLIVACPKLRWMLMPCTNIRTRTCTRPRHNKRTTNINVVTVIGITHTRNSFRWLMYGTVLVFLMQAGFALLEAGSISSKNVKNVLIKNLLDACAGGIVWWAVGYSFAYGDSEYNEFIGSRNYFMYSLVQSGADGYYAGWMFQWVRTRILSFPNPHSTDVYHRRGMHTLHKRVSPVRENGVQCSDIRLCVSTRSPPRVPPIRSYILYTISACRPSQHPQRQLSQVPSQSDASSVHTSSTPVS